MASEFLKSNIVTGLAAGIGASLLAPVLLPFLARIARPITKSVIKTGITCYEKGIESIAELSETLDDLVAEAKVELGEHGPAPSGVAPTTPESPSPTKAGNAPSNATEAPATQPSVSAEPEQKPSSPQHPGKNREAGQEPASRSPKPAPTDEAAGVSSKGASP